MVNRKKTIIAFCCVLVCAVAITAIIILSNKEPQEIILYPMSVINVYDTKEVSGFSDYVFIAKVNKQIETIYDRVEGINRPDTVFSLTVLENIKGKLAENTEIKWMKQGGVSQDGKYFYKTEENEIFPQTDKIYLICAVATDKGELLTTVPTAVVELDFDYESIDFSKGTENAEFKEKTDMSEVVRLYRDSVKNEKFFTLKDRYLSKYDEGGQKIEIRVPYATSYTLPDERPTVSENITSDGLTKNYDDFGKQ